MILNTPLGPIKVSDLPFLAGWRYIIIPRGFPGAQLPLIRGAEPTVLFEVEDEMGWGLSGAVSLTSPFATTTLILDDSSVTLAPQFFNSVSSPFPKPTSPYIVAYNPFTPFGPIYSVMTEPIGSLPYSRRIRFLASLPAAAPIAACAVFAAVFVRIAIVDIRTFLRSIKKFTIEQMAGRRMERYP